MTSSDYIYNEKMSSAAV